MLSLALLLGLISLSTCAPNYLQWAELQPPISQGKLALSSGRNFTNEFFQVVSSAWTLFKHGFDREFKSILDEGERFFIFAKNFIHIHKHNLEFHQGKHSYEMGLNNYSDLSESELNAKLGYRPSLKKHLLGASGSYYMPPYVKAKLPDSVDWRTSGAVTPVKDQGQCGSCWAFSTTGALEGQHFRKIGVLPNLSEQQLVDCSSSYGNMGCNGGLMDNAFMYIKENKGIEGEKDYPYKSGESGEVGTKCQFKEKLVVATDTGFIDLPSGDEMALKQAIAYVGPVSVAINAGLPSFPLYKRGIYDDSNCGGDQSDLDHGVLVVGYGTENGVDYWLIKNSWGTSWGEHGYIRIRRNHNNLCGVATSPSYPLV